MASFTARQGEYLAFIHRYTQKFGVAPSFEDIGRHFGTTPPSVNNMIKTLCARGLLARQPGVARSLRVVVPEWSLPESEFGGKREKSSARANTDALSAADVVCVSVEEVTRDPEGFLHRVIKGESLVVTQHGQPVVEIRPIEAVRLPRPFGLAAGSFVVPDDFDDPLPDDLRDAFEGSSE